MSAFDSIYARLPVFAQHAAVSGYGYYWRWLRFGPGYGRFLQGYLEREGYSAQEWAEYQKQRLRVVLQAALQAPYYAQAWSRTEKEAATAGQLSELPWLEKEPLRAGADAFLCRDLHPRRKLCFYTSGSTGTPISTFWTVDELRDSLALREARSACWAGVSFGQGRATFSGRLVEPDPDSRGPYYRYNLAENQVYLSPFHLRPETAQRYVQALVKHGVRWLTGYAVSYYLLAKMMLEQKLAAPAGLQALITTSEKVTPEMRGVMEEAFGCKVFEEYSTVENVIFASECEQGRLHVSPDAAMVEILRPDGSACQVGETGEVVATGLRRTYQPLIRYRLGDLASWDGEACPCGRQMPVIKEVVGRIEDVVIGPDGRQMVRFHGIFVHQPHVIEGQIIQKALHHIHVKVVPAQGFGAPDEADIIQRVQQRLGASVVVTVEAVDQIPRTKSGKFRAVISELRAQ